MSNLIPSIEILPNELLIELFEYISTYDSFTIFFDLNSRFNSIINSLQNLYLILDEDWDNKESIIPPSFASRIATLIIKHDEQIDFSYFPNIRSLKLCRPTANQCNSIQPDLLPNLKHLFISNLFFSDNSEQLCRLIFSPSFSHLRTCQIDRITFYSFHPYLTLSLRRLTISPSTWKSNMLEQILIACPQLTYLRIIRLRNISFEMISNSTRIHTSLRCLDIQFYSIGERWFKQVDWILSIVPNLENFSLVINENEINVEFPFDLFARLLIQRVPSLIRFKAKIPINKLLTIDSNVIKQLHSLFVHVQFQGCTTCHLIISSES